MCSIIPECTTSPLCLIWAKSENWCSIFGKSVFNVCPICSQSGCIICTQSVFNLCWIRVEFKLNWRTCFQSVSNQCSTCVQFKVIQGIFDQIMFNFCSICVQFVRKVGSITQSVTICVQFAFNSCSITVSTGESMFNMRSISVRRRLHRSEYVFKVCSIRVQSVFQFRLENPDTICLRSVFNTCSILVQLENMCSICAQSVV